MRTLTRVVCSLSLLAAASCQPRLTLALASDREALPQPAFTVADPEHPDRPHYNTVMVFQLDGELLWHLRAEPFGMQNSAATVRYGEPLSHFDTVVEPRPLAVGGEYSLQVSGIVRGTLRFRINEDGRAISSEE